MTTTTKTQEVTPQQRIAILKHLATGKDLDTVAAIMRGTSRDVIGDIARHHGYPDTSKLSWAVDVLVKKEEEAAKASIPAGTTPAPAAPRPATTSPSSITAPAARTAQGPDEIRVLLNTAKGHPSKRIQAAADRVFDQLDKLRGLIREDQEKHAARRQADAEKAAAKAEVARLEAQLREAKAKLRGGTTETQATASSDGPSTKEIRAWAHANGIDCPTRGLLPAAVHQAYDEAHQDGAA